ncbi:response regulator transcription factor [Nocardioides korecus]
MGGAHVLVVDDEENISYLVASALRFAGYEVSTASTGRQALELAARTPPDVLVLDVMLPDHDGLEVMRRLRASGSTAPVILLSARSATVDRVEGLTAGGDDYLTKPFALEELVARVAAVLRRHGPGGGPRGRLSVADLVLDEDAHRVWRGGQEQHLTPTEFTLLQCLMLNVGRVVTRAQILDRVWEYDFAGESAIIESFVSSLRRKVDTQDPRLIHTVRGVGYAVREPT